MLVQITIEIVQIEKPPSSRCKGKALFVVHINMNKSPKTSILAKKMGFVEWISLPITVKIEVSRRANQVGKWKTNKITAHKSAGRD